MIKKESILKALAEFPDEVSLDDFFDKLLLLQKIEKGFLQSNRGDILSEEAAKTKLDKWLK